MKYELKKKKRSKLIYILPISIIAACIVVCLIVMNIFGFGKSGGEQKVKQQNLRLRVQQKQQLYHRMSIQIQRMQRKLRH